MSALHNARRATIFKTSKFWRDAALYGVSRSAHMNNVSFGTARYWHERRKDHRHSGTLVCSEPTLGDKYQPEYYVHRCDAFQGTTWSYLTARGDTVSSSNCHCQPQLGSADVCILGGHGRLQQSIKFISTLPQILITLLLWLAPTTSCSTIDLFLPVGKTVNIAINGVVERNFLHMETATWNQNGKMLLRWCLSALLLLKRALWEEREFDAMVL